MKIFVCFIKQACLLAAYAYELHMWRMPMHIAELIACIIFLYMIVFACLACNPFQIWGG
jgi:hypothetical protein